MKVYSSKDVIFEQIDAKTLKTICHYNEDFKKESLVTFPTPCFEDNGILYVLNKEEGTVRRYILFLISF